MSDSTRSPGHLSPWLIGSFCLLVAFLAGSAISQARAPRWFSPPDRVRPWAEKEYRDSFDSSRHIPFETLASNPVPPLKIDRRPNEIAITFSGPKIPERETSFEIFPADSAGVVALPDGNRLSLVGIALMLPSNVEWKGKRYIDKRPDWIDPVTGQPIPTGPGSEWAIKEQRVPRCAPRLFLRVKKIGNAPLRWHGPEAYDARTQMRVRTAASGSYEQSDGAFLPALRSRFRFRFSQNVRQYHA